MNEHIRIRKAIEALRAQLKSKQYGDDFRGLLANYNNACRQLKQRLSQVDSILLSGNHAGALQMAEADPSILDILTLLGFPESQDLEEWCVGQGISFEGTFDSQAIHRLNEAYSSGHETDAILEKEYRKAVLKRNFAAALPLARSISRLQPGNAKAKTELGNTEKRYAKQIEDKLSAAIDSGDQDAIRHWMAEFDNLNIADFSGGEALRVGREILLKAHNENGRVQITQALNGLPEAPSLEDWATIETVYDRILQVLNALTEDLPADLQKRWDALSRIEMKLRKEMSLQNAQNMALRKLQGVVDRVRSDRLVGKLVGLPQASKSLESLLEVARAAEELGVDVDDSLRTRWSEEVSLLRKEVEIGTAEVKRRRIIISMTSIVMLSLASLFAYQYVRARSIVAEADQVIATVNLSGAEAFLHSDYESEWSPIFAKKVRERCERVQQFVARDNENAEVLMSQIQKVEASKSSWNEGVEKLQLALGEIQVIEDGLDGLSQESRAPLELEVDHLVNGLNVVKQAFRTRIVRHAEEMIVGLEDEYIPRIDYFASPQVLSLAIEETSTELAKSEREVALTADIIPIGEDQRRRLDSIKQHVKKAEAVLQAHDSKIASLRSAQTLGEYFAATSTSLSENYPGSPLPAAFKYLPRELNEQLLKQQALDQVPSSFTDLLALKELPPLSPPTVLLSHEEDAYVDFRFNEMVDNVFQYSVYVPDERTIFSKGKVVRDNTVSPQADISGRLYVYYAYPTVIEFIDYEHKLFPRGIRAIGAIPEARLLEFLSTRDYLDDSGKVIATQSNPAPFLRIIDKIRSSDGCSADYKCYAINQLFKMMESSGRPEQWGLSYLNGWTDEVAKIDNLGIRNGDWLLASSERHLVDAQGVLDSLFDGLSVERLARFGQSFVTKIVSMNVAYHGYLSEGGIYYSVGGASAELYALVPRLGDVAWLPFESPDELTLQALNYSPVVSIQPSVSSIFLEAARQAGFSELETAKLTNRYRVALKL
ncbi:hypothetical protein N9P58_02370 [Puniceicoccaceae bacterium]|nr:hypothetical protein [Puniceicoccaceae bacterium]